MASIKGLSSAEEIQVSAIAVAAVYAIFSLNVPNLADVKAAPPGDATSSNTHASVKIATITSAAVIGGIALLAKNPTVYVVGGIAIIIESMKYHHANMTDTKTGAVIAPGAASATITSDEG